MGKIEALLKKVNVNLEIIRGYCNRTKIDGKIPSYEEAILSDEKVNEKLIALNEQDYNISSMAADYLQLTFEIDATREGELRMRGGLN